MQIVMFINSYIEGLSGGDTWAIEIAKRISKKKDVQVIIVTPKRAATLWKEKELKNCRFIVTTKEKKPGFLPVLYLKRIMNYLFINLNTTEEDILFATSIFIPDVFPFLFKKGKKLAIFHMQAPHPFYGYKSILVPEQKKISFGNIINWMNEKTSMFLLQSLPSKMLVLPSTKKIVQNYGFDENELFITKNGIDLEYIENISRGELRYDACWVGRPHPQKGVDDLIDIWKIVSKEKPEAELVLMGANTESYKNKIEKKGLEKNIIIKGYISEKEKIETMKKSRLFLSTSYFESFHIAVLEALACKLDIIAYDLPVYQQIYGDLLQYIEIGNKKQYADQIINYLKHTPKQLNQSNKAAEFINQFDWNQIAEEFYTVIMKMN